MREKEGEREGDTLNWIGAIFWNYFYNKSYTSQNKSTYFFTERAMKDRGGDREREARSIEGNRRKWPLFICYVITGVLLYLSGQCHNGQRIFLLPFFLPNTRGKLCAKIIKLFCVIFCGMMILNGALSSNLNAVVFLRSTQSGTRYKLQVPTDLIYCIDLKLTITAIEFPKGAIRKLGTYSKV